MPCLYRYSTNDVYYALVTQKGRQHRKSLETTDKTVANRKLADFQRDLGKVDTSQGKLTLRSLCDRYLLTIASQAKDTVALKTAIVKRFLADFSPGANVQVEKVKTSDLQGWNYLQAIKSIFEIAVADKAIVISPGQQEGQKSGETNSCHPDVRGI